MQVIVSILIAGILTENFVLSKFLGICPFLGVSKKLNTALGMSLAVIFVMCIATAVTWPIQTYILDRFNLSYLQTIVFILVIAALVQLVEIILKKYIPSLYNSLGIYLPLITTNCAVLGVTILNFTKTVTDGDVTRAMTYGESILNAFSGGFGFLVAMVIFAGVRSKLEQADIPKALQGLPITLIAASLTSIAFLGFAGLGA